MKFRTEIQPLDEQGSISHTGRLMLLGSCFTTEIGSRLAADGFTTLVNPFGTIYNPASIAQTLMRISINRPFDADDAFESEGFYHSFSSHSSMSSPDLPTFLKRHNEVLAEANRFLKDCSTVIITLGTAWAFCRADNGIVVANCHKLPAQAFNRRLLNVRECTVCLNQAVRSIRSIAPYARVIFTVSPIRHAADGFHGNTVSKSTLHLAVSETIAQTDNTIYFPAFEALIDDLRDYRFYAADMRHPSDVAVDYIYSLFADSFFDGQTKTMSEKFATLRKRTLHRPLTCNESAIADFNNSTVEMAQQLALQYPVLKENIGKILQ